MFIFLFMTDLFMSDLFITNTKDRPCISPTVYKPPPPPLYKPIKNRLRKYTVYTDKTYSRRFTVYTKFANFTGLYFPHFTTIRNQTLQIYSF